METRTHLLIIRLALLPQILFCACGSCKTTASHLSLGSVPPSRGQTAFRNAGLPSFASRSDGEAFRSDQQIQRMRERATINESLMMNRMLRLRGGQESAKPPNSEGTKTVKHDAPAQQEGETVKGGTGGDDSATDLITRARQLKEAGNEALQMGDFATAMKLYTRALQTSKGVRVQSAADAEQVKAFQVACHANKALAALNVDDFEEALQCSSAVLMLDQHHYRALFRRSRALQGLGHFNEAAADLQRLVAYHGMSDEAQDAMDSLRQAAAAHVAMEGRGGGRSSSSGGGARHTRSTSRPGRKGRLAGLRNEGATCYLNAVLQALFHIPAFRRAVYHIPTQPPKPGEMGSVALAMQRLFWRLQTTREAQSTTELLASFGWSSGDALQQQDISDFVHMLLDLVEDSMKNTTVHDEVARLYGAKVQYTDKAQGVEWQKQREDVSMVTLLHGVGECPDVAASLQMITQPETIEGYDTEVHGKQTVERRMQFKQLPPVLLLNINRIGFCPERLEPIKLNDRFAFGEELDLADFTVGDDDGDKAMNATSYRLRSVIVHMGTANVGHYVVYCRPAQEEAGGDGWFCLDDDHVTQATVDEAVKGNFGSDKQQQVPPGVEMLLGRSALLKMRSAYMLMYVREDAEDKVMNVTDLEIEAPAHVREMEQRSRSVSLPQSFTVLVTPPSNASSPSPAAVLRGTPVNLTIADAGAKNVDDLLETLQQVCEHRGMPLTPPTTAQLQGCPPEFSPEGTEVYAYEDDEEDDTVEEEVEIESVSAGPKAGGRRVEVGCGEAVPVLRLTVLRNHMVQEVLSGEAMLSEVDTNFVLRAEWVDAQRRARPVKVMQFAEEEAEEEEEEEEKEEGGEGGEAKEQSEKARRVAYRQHGDPAVLTVYAGETVASVKRRLHKLYGLDERAQSSSELAWVGRGPPFFLRNDTAPALPSEQVLEAHVLGWMRPDPGNGPTHHDFWARSVQARAEAASAGSKGVRLKAKT